MSGLFTTAASIGRRHLHRPPSAMAAISLLDHLVRGAVSKAAGYGELP